MSWSFGAWAMLLIYPDRHMGVECDRCRLHSPRRQPGVCVFGAGERAEREAAGLGWRRAVVEISLGRRRLGVRTLHLCPDCSAEPGPVAGGP